MVACPGCGSYVDDDERECPDCGVTLHIERLKPRRLRRCPIIVALISMALILTLLVLVVGDGTINNKDVRMSVVNVRLGDETQDGTHTASLLIYIENHRHVRGGGIVPKPNEFELTTDKGAFYSCLPGPQNRLPGSIFQGESRYVTLSFNIPSDEVPSLLRYQWGAAVSSTAQCPPHSGAN